MSIFDSPDFKPMERVAGRIIMTVTKSGISFSKQTVSKLGYAHYVQIFINKKEKLIGIRPCEEKENNAIKFVNPSKQKVDYVRWNNIEFTNDINTLIDNSFQETGYKVEGTFLSEENAILFDFKKACQIDNED